jgi:hypothetical protein
MADVVIMECGVDHSHVLLVKAVLHDVPHQFLVFRRCHYFAPFFRLPRFALLEAVVFPPTARRAI